MSITELRPTRRANLRNVAIIAHVDHGKTTLVDALLKQSHVFAAHEQVGELIMDSNVLEREKGITILAKTTSIRYRGIKINIIDTPGHADFGGEVERVLGMADGCLLLVDALEGPMPQTRVVTGLALELGLAPIILVNKIDRVNAGPAETVEMPHDLLLELAKHPDQLNAPVIYTNARAGTATADLRHPGSTLEPLLDALLAQVPPPKGDPLGPLQLLVSNLDHDNHIGRLAIGRIARGQLRARLARELQTNIALKVADGATADIFEVSGRGELHLSILIETMRREGYEFEVSRPAVITRDIDGQPHEPVEECIVDCSLDAVGAITEALGSRGAQLQTMRTDAGSGARLTYLAPTRALIGLRSLILTLTRGTGVMSTRLVGWERWRALPSRTRNGVLTASQTGMAVAYGLQGVQERGQPFIGPGTQVYEGMIIGLNRRGGDIDVNATKQKQKTNMRASTEDATVKLVPPRQMSLEECLDFIEDDELVEVTPKTIRMRKRVLNAGDRIKLRKRELAS